MIRVVKYTPDVDAQPGLPFSGRTPLSRLASYDGARVAQVDAWTNRGKYR